MLKNAKHSWQTYYNWHFISINETTSYIHQISTAFSWRRGSQAPPSFRKCGNAHIIVCDKPLYQYFNFWCVYMLYNCVNDLHWITQNLQMCGEIHDMGKYLHSIYTYCVNIYQFCIWVDIYAIFINIRKYCVKMLCVGRYLPIHVNIE